MIKYTDPSGKGQLAKWKTQQVLTAIRNDIIDVKAKARSSKRQDYLPLSQFPEFTTAMESKVIKDRAQSKAGNMKDIYAKIDKQEKRRRRLKWLFNLTENAIGSIGLIVLIACIIGAGYLIYMTGPWLWEWVVKTVKG